MKGTQIFHFIALRSAVKLEGRGMARSRKPSARLIAINELGLPSRSTHAEVVAAITELLDDNNYCKYCNYTLAHCICEKRE